jgi:hypothetical protein
MIYAIIENGKVVNTVVAEPEFAAQFGWAPLTDNAGIGWDYADGKFVDNRVFPDPQPADPTVQPE